MSPEDTAATVAGRGTMTWDYEAIEGIVREVRTTQDILELMDETPDQLIILMHTAGATTLAPLFEDISGIICTTGEVGSHVSIISREYGIACVVGVDLEDPALNGRRVRLAADGEVHLVAG